MIRAMASSQLQATTDPLTGLLNRRSLEAVLDGIREVGGEFAVVFLDLDHFKDLNDTFGHDTGDRVLRSFAAALRRCSREGDTVARYGGEEFVVLLPEASMSAAAGFYERLKADLESASERGDLPAHTASGGRGRFIAHRRGARGREARWPGDLPGQAGGAQHGQVRLGRHGHGRCR